MKRRVGRPPSRCCRPEAVVHRPTHPPTGCLAASAAVHGGRRGGAGRCGGREPRRDSGGGGGHPRLQPRQPARSRESKLPLLLLPPLLLLLPLPWQHHAAAAIVQAGGGGGGGCRGRGGIGGGWVVVVAVVLLLPRYLYSTTSPPLRLLGQLRGCIDAPRAAVAAAVHARTSGGQHRLVALHPAVCLRLTSTRPALPCCSGWLPLTSSWAARCRSRSQRWVACRGRTGGWLPLGVGSRGQRWVGWGPTAAGSSSGWFRITEVGGLGEGPVAACQRWMQSVQGHGPGWPGAYAVGVGEGLQLQSAALEWLWPAGRLMAAQPSQLCRWVQGGFGGSTGKFNSAILLSVGYSPAPLPGAG